MNLSFAAWGIIIIIVIFFTAWRDILLQREIVLSFYPWYVYVCLSQIMMQVQQQNLYIGEASNQMVLPLCSRILLVFFSHFWSLPLNFQSFHHFWCLKSFPFFFLHLETSKIKNRPFLWAHGSKKHQDEKISSTCKVMCLGQIPVSFSASEGSCNNKRKKMEQHDSTTMHGILWDLSGDVSHMFLAWRRNRCHSLSPKYTSRRKRPKESQTKGNGWWFSQQTWRRVTLTIGRQRHDKDERETSNHLLNQ